MTLAKKQARTKKNRKEGIVFSKNENLFQQPLREQAGTGPGTVPKRTSQEVSNPPRVAVEKKPASKTARGRSYVVSAKDLRAELLRLNKARSKMPTKK